MFAVTACDRSPLDHPDLAVLAKPAPDSFRAVFETSRGTFVIEAHRAWSPLGVDRFYHLVQDGFYDDTRFFRVVPGFVVQFGMHGSPAVSKVWDGMSITDDKAAQSNVRGAVTFAHAGPNTRTTQLFINYVDNKTLDQMGFSPIGTVVEGMAVVDSLFSGYGELAPTGDGPQSRRIGAEGNAYLLRDFPRLDYIKSARIGKARSP
jgi:peptidyl-prolyl cis-trans isomerase A (cyclophilin A)